MKILVLGAGGMAGHTISICLNEAGHDVWGFSRRKIEFCSSITGDVRDFPVLEETILKGKYQAVINCVGLLNQDAENDKANAVLVNSYLPHFLSKITKDIETKVIHMSTDCVFSGKTGGYIENSLKDGETFYDRSKALGEIDNCKDLTFRNSIVGPDINAGGIGLFNWFMKQNTDIAGYSRAIWTGVTTITLAKAMDKALQTGLTGLYNLVNNETISKYDLLGLFNKYFKNGQLNIAPKDMPEIDKSLANTRTDFDFIVPRYDEMTKEMYQWVVSHKNLYPHYNL